MSSEQRLVVNAIQRSRVWIFLVSWSKSLLAAALLAVFVLWAHFGSHLPVFRSRGAERLQRIFSDVQVRRALHAQDRRGPHKRLRRLPHPRGHGLRVRE